jgi:hypothetical protein
MDSVVGIETFYEMKVPRIEFRWEWDFPRQAGQAGQAGQAVGITQPPVQWVPGLFRDGKAARTWLRHPNLEPR